MNNKKNSSLSLRKVLLSALVAAPLVVPAPLWALPTTQQILESSIVSKTTGVNPTYVSNNQVTISTTATNSVIKWTDFGAGNMAIGGTDTVLFQLPSSSAAVLNIVTSSNASTINGLVQSTGGFFLLNPNGITVGATGNIVAGGTVGLSTVNETEFPFLANGNLSYVGTSSAGVTVSSGAAIHAASGSGNVYVAGSTADLAGTIDAGALTVNAGTINLGSGGALVVGNNTVNKAALTVNASGTNNVTLANSVTQYGTSATFALNGGTLTQTAGTYQMGDNKGDVSLTVTGASDVNLTSVTNQNTGKTINANITATKISNLTTGTQVAVTATTTDLASITTTSGSLTLNASSIGKALTLNSSGDLKSGGTSSVGGALSLTSGGSVTYSGSGDLAPTTVTAGSGKDVSLTSTTGSVTLPAITTTGGLSVTAANNITQTGALSVGKDATFDATNAITLTTVTNDFASVTGGSAKGLVLKHAAAGATVIDANSVVLRDGTNTTGTVTLASNGASGTSTITLGGATGEKITVGGDLNINVINGAGVTGNTINQNSDNTTVLGNLNLTAGSTGTITLAGSTNNGVGLKNQYGQVSIASAGSATVYESTVLNLGNVTVGAGTPFVGGPLRVYSATGIIQSGALTVGALTLGAGTGVAPADISLTNANNSFGQVNVLDDVALLSNTAANGATVGNYLAHSLTLVNNASTTIGALSNTYGTGLTGDLNVTATSGTNSITLGNTIVAGKVILNAPGAITATNTNSVSNYTVTSGGAVNVNSSTDVTFNATLTGSSNSTFTSGNTATIGAVTSSSTGSVAFASGNKKDVKDSVSGINIFGPVTFNSANGVSVTKTGHSFGPITVITGNNASATVVESGTLNLASANINVKGSLSLTSTNGDIIQSTGGGIALGNGAGTATFSARSGKVVLDGGTGTNNFQSGAVNVSATNDSTIINNTGSSDLQLGNVTVGSGMLTVQNTAANKAIKQKSGTTVYAYGTTSFTANGSGNITITNSGNQFGGLVLNTTSGNIGITEKTTMNLKSVVTSGSFTATSEGGSIIDSVDSTVTNNSLGLGASTSSFSAPNGNINLALSGSAFGNVSLNTGGNASIISSSGNITLGLSTVGGTLDVMNTASGKNILQSDAINAGGNTTFTTVSGGIDLQNTMNQFGALRFVAGAAGVKLFEATTLNLRGGSVSSGGVVLSTNGDFVTSGTGGSTFTGDLTISALGTIKPAAGSLYVVGTLTVFSTNTKDLSALSKSGNLTGKDPVNLGSGTYVAPTP